MFNRDKAGPDFASLPAKYRDLSNPTSKTQHSPPVSFSIDILLSARRMLGEMTDSLLRNCSRHLYLLLDDSMLEGRSLVSWLGQPKDRERLQIRWELSST